MRSVSDSARRARPLLGTFVEVAAGGAPRADLNAAIEEAFQAVAEIHRLMSFHEPGSDVSRLNRAALRQPVPVHPQTFEVLRWSNRFAQSSRGGFDITVASDLVACGLLPPPDCPYRPDPHGSWRDIELLADGAVRFHRPVWIDLGGIAKGYAVDCAVQRLRAYGIAQCCVNAGGDLRVLGPDAERVHLKPKSLGHRRWPVLEIQNASVASSGGHVTRRRYHHRFLGPHLHGRRRRPAGTQSFASVVSGPCVVADALTKVVLVQGELSDRLLRRYGATAHLHTARHGWRTIGVGT